MFTGLIQSLGTIRRVERRGGGLRLQLAPEPRFDHLVLGESIAVDGACLTVVCFDPTTFDVEVSPETMARTTLGQARIGEARHLERALSVGDRLGGHIVLGHVDGVGTLAARRESGDYTFLTYEVPAGLERYLIAKGSIAIDGVSLTVNAISGTRFEVAIIPHTAAATHLARKSTGAGVNLETDVLAKHVERLLAAFRDDPGAGGPPAGLTAEKLARLGFE